MYLWESYLAFVRIMLSSLKGFVIDGKAPVEKNKLATANILQTITAWEGRYIYDFKQGNHTILFGIRSM